MEFPRCLKHPVPKNTFGGVVFAQTWEDLALWEFFLDQYQVASILELGTWKGGMSLFLGVQCLARGATMTTIDRVPAYIEDQAPFEKLGVQLLTMDILAEESAQKIAEIIQNQARTRLLYCDNGDKPLEIARFVPLLEAGDLVAVHDWETEFQPSDVLPNMEMLLREECESVQSMTRFFRLL